MAFNLNKEMESEQIIKSAAEKYGVDFPAFKNLIWLESRGNPKAMNGKDEPGKGAFGIGQFRSETMKEVGLAWEDRYDPVKNADAAAKYYKSLVDRFGGDTVAASLAYYKGPNSKDITAYQEGRFSDLSKEAQKRVKAVQGTATKTAPNLGAMLPSEGFRYTPNMPETPTLESSMSSLPSPMEQLQMSPQEEMTPISDLGDAYSKAVGRDAGFFEQTGRAIQEGWHQGGGSTAWNSDMPVVASIFNTTGLRPASYLSEENYEALKSSELDKENWGMMVDVPDQYFKSHLESAIASQKELKRFDEDRIDVGMVPGFVGGFIGEFATPAGIASNIAMAPVGLVGKPLAAVGGKAFGWALGATTRLGVPKKAVALATHPIVSAVARTGKMSAVGAGAFGINEGLYQKSRENLGFYHTPDDLKEAVINGAIIGSALFGIPAGAYYATKAMSSKPVRSSKNLDEVLSKTFVKKPVIKEVEVVSKADSEAVNNLINLDKVIDSTTPPSKRGNVVTDKALINEIKGLGNEVNFKTNKDGSITILGGRMSDGTWVGKKSKTPNTTSKIRKSIDKLTKQKDNLVAKYNKEGVDDKQKKALTTRIKKLDKRIAEEEGRLSLVRQESPTKHPDTSNVPSDLRQLLKETLSHTDEMVDKMSAKQAIDKLEYFYKQVGKVQEINNRVRQAIDSAKAGIKDPAIKQYHEAGRKLFTDGDTIFSIEGDIDFDPTETFPTDIPNVRMEDGTILDGNNPLNPFNKQARLAQDQVIESVDSTVKPFGKLKGFSKSVGSLFVNLRDLNSVIHDSEIAEISDLANKMDIPAKGVKTEVDGKIVHTMNRLDGKDTQGNIIREADKAYNKLIKLAEKTEREFFNDPRNAGIPRDDLKEAMGLHIARAVEDTTGKMYDALPKYLKELVDSHREFMTDYYSKFTHLEQFGHDLPQEVLDFFKSKMDPNNYFPRMIDSRKINDWNIRANDEFGTTHQAILHKAMMKGFDKNPSIVNAFKSWLERNETSDGVLFTKEQINSMSNAALRKLYEQESAIKSNNITKLDRTTDVDVIDGETLSIELDEIKLDTNNTHYDAPESAKMMKERFPMDTSVEVELTKIDGSTETYSFDSEIRDADYGNTMFNYHRVAGSELSNYAVHGRSYASMVNLLNQMTHNVKGITDPDVRLRAENAIEGMRRLQTVFRKSSRVKTKSAIDKGTKLLTQLTYNLGSAFFGANNLVEAGLSSTASIRSYVASKSPELQDLSTGKDVKLTQRLAADFAAMLIGEEAHRTLVPRKSKLSQINADIFGSGGSIVTNLEYGLDKLTQANPLARFNSSSTDFVARLGERNMMYRLVYNAMEGIPFEEASSVVKTGHMSKEVYDGIMNLIIDQFGIHNGEAHIKDRNVMFTTKEGRDLRRVLDNASRESMQTSVGGQQTFGNMGPVWRIMTQFQDFSRRSIGRSKYLLSQAKYNDRKEEMFWAGIATAVMDSLLTTGRVYLASLAFPEQEREKFIESRLSLEKFILNNGIARNPIFAAHNAFSLPLQMFTGRNAIELGYTAATGEELYGGGSGRQAYSFAPERFTTSSGKGFVSGLAGQVASSSPSLSMLGSQMSALINVGKASMTNSMVERNKALDAANRDVKRAFVGNPLLTPATSKAIDQLYY